LQAVFTLSNLSFYGNVARLGKNVFVDGFDLSVLVKATTFALSPELLISDEPLLFSGFEGRNESYPIILCLYLNPPEAVVVGGEIAHNFSACGFAEYPRASFDYAWSLQSESVASFLIETDITVTAPGHLPFQFSNLSLRFDALLLVNRSTFLLVTANATSLSTLSLQSTVADAWRFSFARVTGGELSLVGFSATSISLTACTFFALHLPPPPVGHLYNAACHRLDVAGSNIQGITRETGEGAVVEAEVPQGALITIAAGLLSGVCLDGYGGGVYDSLVK
jgi:hypothetical protein